MNFRQRLTNVLTIVFIFILDSIPVTEGIDKLANAYKGYATYGTNEIIHILWLTPIALLLSAGVSFLMGTGFKAWHTNKD